MHYPALWRNPGVWKGNPEKPRDGASVHRRPTRQTANNDAGFRTPRPWGFRTPRPWWASALVGVPSLASPPWRPASQDSSADLRCGRFPARLGTGGTDDRRAVAPSRAALSECGDISPLSPAVARSSVVCRPLDSALDSPIESRAVVTLFNPRSEFVWNSEPIGLEPRNRSAKRRPRDLPEPASRAPPVR